MSFFITVHFTSGERTKQQMALGSDSSEDRHATVRIAPRYQFEARIAIRMPSGETREGWARDISESGMGAFVAREIGVGDTVVLTFRVTDSVRLVLPAQVVSAEGTRYGFRFTALSAEQRVELQSALRRRSEIGVRGRSHHAGSERQPRLQATKRPEPVMMSFADRARKIIKRGYTPKVAVELALHELESEYGSNPWIMENARIDAEEFLRKVRDGII
jgi:PilZ domain